MIRYKIKSLIASLGIYLCKLGQRALNLAADPGIACSVVVITGAQSTGESVVYSDNDGFVEAVMARLPPRGRKDN